MNESTQQLKEQRHRQCRCEQAYRVFESGIVNPVIRPSKDIEIDLFTPCDPDEGGEGGA